MHIIRSTSCHNFVTLTNKFQGNPITYDVGVGGAGAGGGVEVNKGLVFLIPGTRSDEQLWGCQIWGFEVFSVKNMGV